MIEDGKKPIACQNCNVTVMVPLNCHRVTRCNDCQEKLRQRRKQFSKQRPAKPALKVRPKGKYKKAYQAGMTAARGGKPIEDNPHKFGSDISMSSWWETGYLHHAKQRIERKA